MGTGEPRSYIRSVSRSQYCLFAMCALCSNPSGQEASNQFLVVDRKRIKIAMLVMMPKMHLMKWKDLRNRDQSVTRSLTRNVKLDEALPVVGDVVVGDGNRRYEKRQNGFEK